MSRQGLRTGGLHKIYATQAVFLCSKLLACVEFVNYPRTFNEWVVSVISSEHQRIVNFTRRLK